MSALDRTIRDVSETLLDLLKNGLGTTSIALASPKNAGTNLLTLFLYQVLENPDLKNAEPPALPLASGELRQPLPPLTLDLHYLLTAHPTDQLQAHEALGRAMRVFFEHGVIRGSLLRADNPTTGLTPDSLLRLTLNPTTTEEMSRIWGVFADTPYAISVAYLVTPVPIQSEVVLSTAPVLDQVHEYGQIAREAEVGA